MTELAALQDNMQQNAFKLTIGTCNTLLQQKISTATVATPKSIKAAQYS